MLGFVRNPTVSRFEIPRKIGSLYEIAPDIVGLRTGIANVYFLGEPGAVRWVLVDAGLPGFAGRIRRAAEERFGAGATPAAIVLTHGHFDHVGGLRDLLQHWNINVFAHRMELPFLTGRSSYPPLDSTVGGGLFTRLSVLYPRKPIILGSHVQALPNDGTLPAALGWRWVHTPGHTPGHISLFREADRAMIVGDAFVTVRQESLWAVLHQEPGIHGPPAYFTIDWQAARESVEHLAGMNPHVVACGHGLPLRGEQMLTELRDLAAHFDQRALPRQGRYVGRPAVANANGVVSVPPPLDRPLRNAFFLAAVVLGAAWVGVTLLRNHRERRLGLGF